MTPVVVSYSRSSPKHDERFAEELRALGGIAGKAASAAGLAVRWVDAAAPDASADDLVARTRGVIVLGGADVDPAMYGQEPAGTYVESTDAAADAFEGALMRSAIAARKPVLAICRGAQLLNVVFGGTLVQHLGDGIHSDPGPIVPMTTHSVEVAAGTRLAGILGAGSMEIRSGHHQAIDRVGGGLVVSAVAPDGMVEAIEIPGDAWVIAVQWHPEDAAADPAPLRALLQAFAEAAVG